MGEIESKTRFRRPAMNWALAERKPFPCPTCGQRFSAHNSMRDHARGIHKIIIEAFPEEHWAVF